MFKQSMVAFLVTIYMVTVLMFAKFRIMKLEQAKTIF